MTEILYPGAAWRPLEQRPTGARLQPLMTAHDVICLHTMGGRLSGTDAFFRRDGYDGTESHFGVGADGLICQWQDLARTADANLDGNHRVISIETADVGDPFPAWDTRTGNVPAWTPAQLDALAGLIAWLCARFDIPPVAIPDSRPGRRGVGWHRLGIDPWRAPGGEKWSAARGKVCPGDRRIAQIPGLVAAAAALLNSPTAAPPPPTPIRSEDTPVLIPLTYLDDRGRPDPAGLRFRAACPIETAARSQVLDRVWVRWFVAWGSATWKVVAWDGAEDQGGKPIGECPNVAAGWWELPRTGLPGRPPGVWGFTVEGSRSAPDVQPSVLLLSTPKQ